jgi:hypothetical protein
VRSVWVNVSSTPFNVFWVGVLCTWARINVSCTLVDRFSPWVNISCNLFNIIWDWIHASCALVKARWTCVNAIGAGLGFIDAEL